VVKSIMAVRIRTADELDAASESINEDMSQIKEVQYQHADIAADTAASENPAERTVAPVRSGPKVGRNDPCPCGSGKKYKACCGALS
jgi:preprotein translocase subunit SecA